MPNPSGKWKYHTWINPHHQLAISNIPVHLFKDYEAIQEKSLPKKQALSDKNRYEEKTGVSSPRQ